MAYNSTTVAELGQSVTAVLGATPAIGAQIVNYTIVSPPTHGTVILTNASVGVILYSPNSGYTGSDSFTFSATDNHGNVSNTATLTIVQDTPPSATNTIITTNVNQAVTNSLSAAPGVAGATLTYKIVTPPTYGTASLNNINTGAFTYTPNLGYAGNDSFTYSATDNYGLVSNAAVVSVQVTNTSSSSGGGALDWLSLTIIGLLALARRRS